MKLKIFINENINSVAYKQMYKDIQRIEELKKKQSLIQNSNLYYIDKIFLLEDCKKFGTLPFGISRVCFYSN